MLDRATVQRYSRLAGNAICEAEDALARLDERLRTSSVREGWANRTHILDAAANLWLEGNLVPVEDLVLHDHQMDVRAPTHELTRAHMFLRGRRRIAASRAGWALEQGNQHILLQRLGAEVIDAADDTQAMARQASGSHVEDEFAEIDALLARTDRLLTNKSLRADKTAEITEDRFSKWRQSVAAGADLSSVEAAATAGQAWVDLRPIENAAWLGPLLAADVLRIRSKTQSHLCTLCIGLKAVARADRHARDPATRFSAWVQGIRMAAEAGLRDHDRWLATKNVLESRLKGRRSTSKLPALVSMVISQPIVTSATISRELGISARAAPSLAAELGLREMTGRARYRAWGIL